MAEKKEARKRLEDLLEGPELDEAITDLARIAYRLKESGLLDMLVALADQYEELLQGLGADQRVYHTIAAAQAVLDGMRNADPWKYKPAIQLMTHCAMQGMDPEELSKAKPVGLLGLLGALRDPDISFGLGVLLAMAKKVARCMRTEMEKQLKTMEELQKHDLSRKQAQQTAQG